MDFLGGMPTTLKGDDYLFFIVDRFNKMTIPIPYKKTITRQHEAKLLFKHIWVHFRLSIYIISL